MALVPLDLIKEQLKQRDPDALCELLLLTSEEILERFEDRVEERRRYLESEFEILDSSIPEEELIESDEEYLFDADEGMEGS